MRSPSGFSDHGPGDPASRPVNGQHPGVQQAPDAALQRVDLVAGEEVRQGVRYGVGLGLDRVEVGCGMSSPPEVPDDRTQA